MSQLTPQSEERLWLRLVLLAMGFGIACRLTQYLIASSLWYDESFVALNFLQKSFRNLLGPLDWDEAAPPGFLIAEKIIAAALGRSELTLRLLPMIASLAALVCFAALSRRLCKNGAAWFLAVLSFAAWPTAIGHAGMLKHFSFDEFSAAAILMLALQAFENPKSRLWMLLWGITAALAVWFSFAAVFSFFATSLILAGETLRERQSRRGFFHVGVSLMVLASMTILYGAVAAQRSVVLLGYWNTRGGFPDFGSLFSLAEWVVQSTSSFFGFFWRAPGLLLFTIVVLGVISFWNRKLRMKLAMLILAPCAALAAAGVHFWPFGGNEHMSFAAPIIFVLLGEGMECLRAVLSNRRRWIGEAALACLLGPTLVNAAWRMVQPRHNRELRKIFAFVERNEKPGDAFVVTDAATAEFYTGREFRQLRPSEVASRARVWLITIPLPDALGAKDQKAFEDRLKATRPIIAHDEEYGAEASLFGPEHDENVERK
jgi:hypothetical protein